MRWVTRIRWWLMDNGWLPESDREEIERLAIQIERSADEIRRIVADAKASSQKGVA